MEEIAPSLPDAHIFRTYLQDYAASDTESEGEAHFEVDTEDEEQYSIATRLVQNQEYMDQQIAPPSAWVLEPQAWQTTEGDQRHQTCPIGCSIRTFMETFRTLVLSTTL